MIDEKEKEYEGVIRILKSLQQVKTPPNFEADLMRRINSENFRKEEAQESWLERIFVPKRFIPSAALAIAAVVILFVLNLNPSESDDPFNTQPRVREDVMASTQFETEQKVGDELQKMEENRNSGKSLDFDVNENNFSGFYVINKSGLNFKQVNLTQGERREINRLKENIMRLMKKNE